MSTQIVGLDGIRWRWYQHAMLTPEQSRAARGWLDWSQDHLAKLAHVSLSTVRDFEKGRRIPIGNNLTAIQRAFDEAGLAMAFDPNGKPTGVVVKENIRQN